jgi:hypothetical protein
VLRKCSPSAQIKAAAAQVQTLKRNQWRKKLSITYVEAGEECAADLSEERIKKCKMYAGRKL